MTAPKDPALFLTVFVALSVFAILVTWFLMPIYHIELDETHGMGKGSVVSINLVLPPEKLLNKVNAAIQTGAAALEQLESEEKEKAGGDEEAEDMKEGK